MRLLHFIMQILSKNYHLGGLRQPFSRVESLELHTGFNKHNLPGLAHLFRNSPQTQTLVLKIVNDQTAERRVSLLSHLSFFIF